MDKQRPTLGLALSGSGNRSSFYIGFLEVLDEQKITIDYISACSGGSLVAAAYACGRLEEFKQTALAITKDKFKELISKSPGRGGLYSLDLVEEELLKFTRGLTFEEVKPHMGFVAADIETGEEILLCMGDIARAARISCTLPGVFDPVKWGGKTLVDGGLLTMVPVNALKQAGMDICVGINMRGTKHIFTERQITLKRVFNFFKKYLFIDGITSWVNGLVSVEEHDFSKKPGIFTVIGKSMDLAIKASDQERQADEADLVITPDVDVVKRLDFDPNGMKLYYELGRTTAEKYVPEIAALVARKESVRQTA